MRIEITPGQQTVTAYKIQTAIFESNLEIIETDDLSVTTGIRIKDLSGVVQDMNCLEFEPGSRVESGIITKKFDDRPDTKRDCRPCLMISKGKKPTGCVGYDTLTGEKTATMGKKINLEEYEE